MVNARTKGVAHPMNAWSSRRRFRLFSWGWLAYSLPVVMALLVGGCVAQQADVVRIKRELDAKIHQLNQSKTSLQEAVGEANAALNKANSLIARQRAEIQELVHARAELMDQVETLKDTDLSQVRGAIEQNEHRAGELEKKLTTVQIDVGSVRAELQETQKALDPVVQQMKDRLGAEERLLTEQGGKLGEFRVSLVEYQKVLQSVQQSISKQERQVVTLHQDVQDLRKHHEGQQRQVQTHFEEVRQSLQSVVGALEKVSTKFGTRLDEHEKRLTRISTQEAPRSIKKASVGKASSALSPIRIPSTFQPSSSVSSHSRELPNRRRAQDEGVPQQDTLARVEPIQTPRNITPPPSSGHPSAKRSPTQSANARQTYAQAFQRLRQRDYVAAAQQFSRFLRVFPESSLAANAQYWLGECYYGQRRFQEAIDEFERVFAFYPTSNKVPASLLKIGYSHLERKEPAMAKAVFQQLVRTYPQSVEAIKAHGRLQEVNALLATRLE